MNEIARTHSLCHLAKLDTNFQNIVGIILSRLKHVRELELAHFLISCGSKIRAIVAKYR